MGTVGTTGVINSGIIDVVPDKYKNINPEFKFGISNLDKSGFNNNCAKCAIAFEANMRGNDVEAKPFKFGYGEEIDRSKNIANAFGLKSSDEWYISGNKETAIREIISMAEDWGIGSRGIIRVEAKGLRHVMNVVNDNDKIKIVDAQSGTVGSVKTMLKGLPTHSIYIFRTDNKSINNKFAEWAYRSR